MSQQAWAIIPKIREVDAFLQGQPKDQTRVREVHPEVCFYFMAGGRPMEHRKKKLAGRDERAALLRTHFGDEVDSGLAMRRRLGCEPDDVLDALVALWTARRIQLGTAVTLPASPVRDTVGLRMEMVA
jgi:predicted RNase H-like nuclease